MSDRDIANGSAVDVGTVDDSAVDVSTVDDNAVNVGMLTSWLDSKGVGTGPISDAVTLTGGTQNILVRFVRNGREYVFRRPPLHKRSNSDETMRREARILTALGGTDVPHPRLVAACDDPDVMGFTFFVMDAISGFTATTEVPEPHASSAELQHAMGLAMSMPRQPSAVSIPQRSDRNSSIVPTAGSGGRSVAGASS